MSIPNAPTKKYFPENKPFDDSRPLKAIILGAGIAGIACAALLPNKVRNLSYTVYEKNDRVGGTWAENVYPGVRCDVPSHVYQLSFAPNLDWSEYYPKGAEIQNYYEKVVRDFGIQENLHLGHEIIHASWSTTEALWKVRIKILLTGDIIEDSANFLISCQGRLNKWTYPDIPGLQTKFKGELFHTSKFDTKFDPKGKRIAIIGNGASGQQLLPNILDDVTHIDHYARSRQWMTPAFRGNLLVTEPDRPGGPVYTEKQKARWKQEPSLYLEYRRSLEKSFHGGFPGGIKGSPENEAFRQVCRVNMLKGLDGDMEWLEKLLPDYAPGCKRPTTAPGYLRAIRDPKVSFITESISEATETGLVTIDGEHRAVDVIIAATGHADGFLPRQPTIGLNGIDLSQHWSVDGPIGYPETYFGIMAPGFPNFFFVLQAQGNGGGGSVPWQCEISATYIAKAIRKIQSQSYSALHPSEEATAEFNEIVEGYFDDKVTGDSCSSWFKTGKGKTRVLLAWPGSGHHRFSTCRDPRWEDFIFDRYPNASRNRYEYFGNGFTERERLNATEDVTGYLHEVGDIDLATIHEAWNI